MHRGVGLLIRIAVVVAVSATAVATVAKRKERAKLVTGCNSVAHLGREQLAELLEVACGVPGVARLPVGLLDVIDDAETEPSHCALLLVLALALAVTTHVEAGHGLEAAALGAELIELDRVVVVAVHVVRRTRSSHLTKIFGE